MAITRPGFSEAPLEMLRFGVNTLEIFLIIYFVVPIAFLHILEKRMNIGLSYSIGVNSVWFFLVMLFLSYNREFLNHGIFIWKYSFKWWYLKKNIPYIMPCLLVGVGYWLGGKVYTLTSGST